MADFQNPVTLEEVKQLLSEDWKKEITNDFLSDSFFSSHITFHSLKNPVTGGSGMTHKFTRMLNTRSVSGRLINERYEDDKVSTFTESVDVKIFGGTFALDRVLADAGTLDDEIYMQMSNLASSTSRYFDQQCIIGDSNSNPKEFDGLVKIIKAYGRDQDASKMDISTTSIIKENWRDILEIIDEWLLSFDKTPTFIGGNRRMIACLRAVAREVGVYETTRDEWGHNIGYYDGIPLIDFGYKVLQKLNPYGAKGFEFSRSPIVETNADGTSYLIAGRFGRDAIYGICPSSERVVRYWPPDFEKNVDPVQLGGCEMLSAMVVNKIESVGMLDNIKIQPVSSTKKGVLK